MLRLFFFLCSCLLFQASLATPVASDTTPAAAQTTPVFSLQVTTGALKGQYVWLNGHTTVNNGGDNITVATFTNVTWAASTFFVDSQAFLHHHHHGTNKGDHYVAIISQWVDDPGDFGWGQVFFDGAYANNTGEDIQIICPPVNSTIGAVTKNYNCRFNLINNPSRPGDFFIFPGNKLLAIEIKGGQSLGERLNLEAKTLYHV